MAEGILNAHFAPDHRPLIVDSFAGGGGASTGIEMALDRSPDLAINHNPVALAMHAANHPETLHLSENIYKVDPLDYVAGKHIGLAWFSPDCKHFSKAKGGKPVERNIRDLAWVIPHWVERVQKSGGRIDCVILENVEEFQDYGPLIETPKGLMPDPERKGETFNKWCRKLRSLGGRIEKRELRACDYGAPTIRKRLFIIIRFDGVKIVWPKPTHGKPDDPDVISGRKKPWRTAAEIIDWSLPCPSIFDTAEEIYRLLGLRAVRPLADATMSRVARGVDRYVLKAKRPFIVNLTHGVRCEDLAEPFNTLTAAHRGEKAIVAPSVVKFQSGSTGHPADEPLHTVTANSFKKRPGGAAPLGVIAPSLIRTDMHSAAARNGVHGPDEPIRTVTSGGGFGVAAPYLVPRYGEREGQDPRTLPADAPMPTIVPTSNQGSLAAVYLAQHNTDMVGHAAEEPVSTIVQKGCTQSVVAASLINMKGSARADSAAQEPVPTICSSTVHAAVVAPFMQKYYGTGDGQRMDDPCHTVTVKDRLGFVEAALGPELVEGPPLTESQLGRAHQVASFLRAHGFWDDERELVTVTIAGVEFVIVDIGMRMLTPRELFSAQGFPPDYIIELDHDGRPLSKSEQIACCGNSVSPPLAAALVGANCPQLARYLEAAE